MSSYNHVVLVGNLTADPELQYIASGTARGKFSIAVNRKFKDGSGQLQEETTFVPITVWGSQAETCSNYLTKGRSVLVDGRLRITSFTDKDENKRKYAEVVAQSVQFLDSPSNVAGQDQDKPAKVEEEVPF